jgi:hypothetical protein
MTIPQRQTLMGLPFWSDAADRFGPSLPTLDRINPDGPYNVHNGVVLLGVNALRGRGPNADMCRTMQALSQELRYYVAVKAAEVGGTHDGDPPLGIMRSVLFWC